MHGLLYIVPEPKAARTHGLNVQGEERCRRSRFRQGRVGGEIEGARWAMTKFQCFVGGDGCCKQLCVQVARQVREQLMNLNWTDHSCCQKPMLEAFCQVGNAGCERISVVHPSSRSPDAYEELGEI